MSAALGVPPGGWQVSVLGLVVGADELLVGGMGGVSAVGLVLWVVIVSWSGGGGWC